MKIPYVAPAKTLVRSACLFFTCMTVVNVWAAEPRADTAVLFNLSDSTLVEQFVSMDFDPVTPGLELLIFNEGESTILPPEPGPVRGETKVKIAMYSTDGATLLAESPTMRVWSDSYPDPGDPDNQQGGASVTAYGSWDGGFMTIASGTPAADARNMVLDNVGFPVGFGIGATNGATTRTLVFGVGIDIAYYSDADGDVSSAKFKIVSLDATSLSQLCVLVIPRIDQWGWEFDALAALGNFLAGGRASDDEIRITKFRERTLIDEQQTIYYDPRTCAELSRINLIARRP